jgi:hypothetical protein
VASKIHKKFITIESQLKSAVDLKARCAHYMEAAGVLQRQAEKTGDLETAKLARQLVDLALEEMTLKPFQKNH